jgi:hypothetical protein
MSQIQHYFDLHGEDDWIEWAAALMPSRVAELEIQRKVKEEVLKEVEHVEGERKRMEELRRKAEMNVKSRTVSAHVSRCFSSSKRCMVSLRSRSFVP